MFISFIEPLSCCQEQCWVLSTQQVLYHLIFTSIWHRYFETSFKLSKVRHRNSTELRTVKSTAVQFQKGVGWVEVEEIVCLSKEEPTTAQISDFHKGKISSFYVWPLSLMQSIIEIAFMQFWWNIHSELSPSHLPSMSGPQASEPKWSTLIPAAPSTWFLKQFWQCNGDVNNLPQGLGSSIFSPQTTSILHCI